MKRASSVLLSFAVVASIGLPARAGDAPAGGYGYSAALGGDLDKTVGEAVGKGKKFLLGKRDEASGAFAAKSPIAAGMTALATLAMIGATPRESVSNDPTITKSLEFLASRQKPATGAIAGENEQYANYETSLAISAFASARIGKFAAAQSKARDYVLSLQIQDEKSVNFGGQPYEKEDPPYASDLSNAQHAAQAVHDAAAKDQKETDYFSRLVKFLDHTQNSSERNTTAMKMTIDGKEKEVVSGNDGGAGYGPGHSQAGHEEAPGGKMSPRSYGSMTYALLKCLLFAGVKADDPRVVAAVGWLSKNFTVEKNPGFDEKDPKAAQQGYFYYCLTMARALAEYERANGNKPFSVKDESGATHEWRKELAKKLVSLQKPDGSWLNEKAERWEEGNPVVATAYVVQALAICQGRLP